VAQWKAEVRVDEELARRLIAEQFPPLPERSLAFLGEGWDYVAFLVDEALVFRFPRRQVGIAGTEREIAKLPLLAPFLPVAIPDPVHVGAPSDTFPWPFYCAPYIAGAEPDGSLGDDVRGALARPLARVLRALHAKATLTAVGDGLPVDPMGRADMQVRVPRARESIAAIADLWQPPEEAEALLEEALTLPKPEPRAVCHGDLHFRQLLVNGDVLTGIVDWVDICLGDPVMDVSLVYGFLPRAERDAFFAEYGEVLDRASDLRARVLALNLMSILARYGHDEGLPGVKAEALAALGRVFS
jgi:aminoglycoside phosphotransferase (APT) family kinase protein